MDPRAYTFEAGRIAIEELISLLEQHGVNVSPGSSLERMTLSVYDILYHKDPSYSRDVVDLRQGFSDLAAAERIRTPSLSWTMAENGLFMQRSIPGFYDEIAGELP